MAEPVGLRQHEFSFRVRAAVGSDQLRTEHAERASFSALFAGTIADRERAERTYVVYGLRVRLSVDEGT